MDSVTLFLLACGLAMDAFAVSLSNGLCYHNFRRSQAALSAVTFGIFQAIMPVIGYFAGRFFSEAISSVDHWIAFILLGLIGGHMLLEAIREIRHPEACAEKRPFTLRILLVQAVATSIDALAVGVSFAVVDTNLGSRGNHRHHHLRFMRDRRRNRSKMRRVPRPVGKASRRGNPAWYWVQNFDRTPSFLSSLSQNKKTQQAARSLWRPVAMFPLPNVNSHNPLFCVNQSKNCWIIFYIIPFKFLDYTS